MGLDDQARLAGGVGYFSPRPKVFSSAYIMKSIELSLSLKMVCAWCYFGGTFYINLYIILSFSTNPLELINLDSFDGRVPATLAV